MNDITGIPTHPLVVHAVVVLVPLTAVGAVLVALWPWARAHVGWLVAAFAALDVVLVPLATSSGENLEERVPETALMEKHAEMGGQLTPWVIVLAAASVAVMVLARVTQRVDADARPTWAAPWVTIAVAAVTIVAASGAMVQVVRIGHSGADASWSDVGSPRG